MGNPTLTDGNKIQQAISNVIKHLPSAGQVARELTTLTGNVLNKYIEDMLVLLNQDNNMLLNLLDIIEPYDVTTIDMLELHDLSTKLKNIISYLEGFRHCLNLRSNFEQDEYI